MDVGGNSGGSGRGAPAPAASCSPYRHWEMKPQAIRPAATDVSWLWWFQRLKVVGSGPGPVALARKRLTFIMGPLYY